MNFQGARRWSFGKKSKGTWGMPLCLALGLIQGFGAHDARGQTLTVEEKLRDLDQLVTTLSSGYGPLKYKEQELGIRLPEVRERYAEKIRQSRSNAEFYYLLSEMVSDFRDSHFGAIVPSSRNAKLGFSTDLVDGKVLIDSITRKDLPESVFPFQRGDEIVEWNGKPVLEEVSGLMRTVPAGYELTRKRRATMSLGDRPASRFRLPAQDEKVTLKVRRGTSQVIDSVELKWTVTGEGWDEGDFSPTFLALEERSNPIRLDDLSLRGDDFYGNGSGENSYRCSGKTRIEIPKGAKILIEDPFVAYIYESGFGKVGYLRIPHYSWQNEQTGKDEYDLRFKQYEWVISELERDTVGLIIDQDHNCGGSVDYLHRMLSLFMDKPFATTQFQFLGSKESVLEFNKWLGETDKWTLEYHALNEVFQLVKSAWKKGDYLTGKSSIDGRAMMSPNPVHYTKPVLMLIDEMSGSGGDAFPAMMQGLGRAKLLGTRTMGAGGHVVSTPPLQYSQISLRLTKSLFYRPDGVAVENNGATPDYPYTITRDDFIYGYRDYFKFAEGKLKSLIP
jgi:hypothetical protein